MLATAVKGEDVQGLEVPVFEKLDLDSDVLVFC
jgi:hypothetical protein